METTRGGRQVQGFPSASGWFLPGRMADQGFMPSMPLCTHLGCQVLWDPTRNRFRCPCHGSEFSADGRNLVGPAVRPLIRYRLSLRTDGQLVVELAAPLDVSTSQTDPRVVVVVPDEVFKVAYLTAPEIIRKACKAYRPAKQHLDRSLSPLVRR